MAVDRPTFSESWYRVCQLKPRLRSTVQTYRQHYRGEMWHVVRDPGNNQFFRLNVAAYHFVALLDGKRSIEKVWEICNEELGDEAPTQGEAIQLLGQLYTSNLLAAELPADAAGMFDRYKKRVRREVGGYMKNLLFIRIPLIDPDRFLDRWVALFGLAFTMPAFVVWVGLLLLGFNFLSGRWGELFAAGNPQSMLAADNLVFLYLTFAGIKAVHEFGHAFACKKFGRDAQSGGEVHTMGIMFLVFMPIPYVDASSSWALRSKWQRITIGAAGMYVELAMASIAAIVWSQTAQGSVINILAFNLMFIASVSTVLFNGNPLLRYDAYYIFSDTVEVPNLSQRSKDYIYYLVKRYAYGVRRPRNPSHTAGERFWMVVYGLASSIYRIFICVAILLFVADKLFLLGALLAVSAVVTWVCLPIGKWINYLASNPELIRTRPRAVFVTVAAVGVVVMSVGAIPVMEHARADGVVEPRQERFLFMTDAGFIRSGMKTDLPVKAGGEPVLVAENRELETERNQLMAEHDVLRAKYYQAFQNDEDMPLRQYLRDQLDDVNTEITRLNTRLDGLRVRSPIDGVWISSNIDQKIGAYLPRGEPLGRVANISNLFIRATANNEVGPRVETGSKVEVRVKGRPDIAFRGRIEKIGRAGTQDLSTPALSIGAGGSIPTRLDDQRGTRTTEQVFEMEIADLQDDEGGTPAIKPYQRVVVRFEFGRRPLAVQWWRKTQRLVQRRFNTTL